MKKAILSAILLLMIYTISAQESAPISSPTVSTLARIQETNTVRVGILYNEQPFGVLSVSGEVTGFDADLARLMVEESWELQLELVQVTRQNALDMLKMEHVDLLMAAIVHDRALDAEVEFSHTYYVGSQRMMVRADDSAQSLNNMANRQIGAVVGTEGAEAITNWQNTTGLPVNQQIYLTLDQAFVALAIGEVDGVVAKEHRLQRIAADQPDLIKFIEEPVQIESYGVVLPRGDSHLRNLVNRTLQYLVSTDALPELHTEYFPGQDFAFDVIPTWANIGDSAPRPADFATEIARPERYGVSRILEGSAIRVAGLADLPEDASLGQRRINDANRAIIEAMVNRWGTNVEFLPNSANALSSVANGEADVAVGVTPDWLAANQVDFTLPYLLHGDRLMVPTRSQVEGFNELRGRWIGIMNNDDGAEQRAREWADSINASVRFYTTFESDAAFTILVENNADVIYGDSLKLLGHLNENPTDLRLTERWYSRNYVALAVPHNDVDFRLLVDYTLQELYQDGTLQSIVASVFPEGDEFPQLDVWQGEATFMGINLSR